MTQYNLLKLSNSVTYFTDKKISFVEVSAKHFRRFSGNGFDLDADLFALLGRFNLLVVAFDARNNAKVQELKKWEIGFDEIQEYASLVCRPLFMTDND